MNIIYKYLCIKILYHDIKKRIKYTICIKIYNFLTEKQIHMKPIELLF